MVFELMSVSYKDHDGWKRCGTWLDKETVFLDGNLDLTGARIGELKPQHHPTTRPQTHYHGVQMSSYDAKTPITKAYIQDRPGRI